MNTVSLKIGDCFVIPLEDDRFAYGQYVHYDRILQYGYLVRIFDLITNAELDVRNLQGRGALFPPLFVQLPRPIAQDRWRKIGWLPVDDFEYPCFRVCPTDRAGIHHDWEIWDGKRFSYIGKLLERYRSLEFMGIWGADILEERIISGANPFNDYH